MLKFRTYVHLWLVILALLSFESFSLNFHPELSLLHSFQRSGLISKQVTLTPSPGKTVSLWLGWIGFSMILLTNIYVIRKRLGRFKVQGSVAGWLNFHIFCGLVGPTLILFHTNFKIGGLVAMSFWSMAISFVSGLVGRYFYVQVITQKNDLEEDLLFWDNQIKQFSPSTSSDSREDTKSLILSLAGASTSSGGFQATTAESVLNSIWGDLRLRFGLRGALGDLSEELRHAHVKYAVTRRRILYLEQFRLVMGYWHSFHAPFAIFMYLVAVIHIVTALVLQV